MLLKACTGQSLVVRTLTLLRETYIQILVLWGLACEDLHRTISCYKDSHTLERNIHTNTGLMRTCLWGLTQDNPLLWGLTHSFCDVMLICLREEIAFSVPKGCKDTYSLPLLWHWGSEIINHFLQRLLPSTSHEDLQQHTEHWSLDYKIVSKLLQMIK